jgi:hypothetical protein
VNKTNGKNYKRYFKRSLLSRPDHLKEVLTKRAAKNAIKLYNEIRLYLSLGYGAANISLKPI